MDEHMMDAWRAVLDYVVAIEKQRLGLHRDGELATAWGIQGPMLSVMRHRGAKSHKPETFAPIDEGLRRSGRTKVWDGWFKRLYDLCHPPSPRYCSEVARHLADVDILRSGDAIRTPVGTIVINSDEGTAEKVCRALPVIPPEFEANPMTIVVPEWCGEIVCFPEAYSEDIHAFGVRMANESMAPRYLQGDVIVASPEAPLRNEQPAAFKVQGHAPDCRIFREGDNRIELLPLNHAYVRAVYERHDFDWIFPVVGLLRKEAIPRVTRQIPR